MGHFFFIRRPGWSSAIATSGSFIIPVIVGVEFLVVHQVSSKKRDVLGSILSEVVQHNIGNHINTQGCSFITLRSRYTSPPTLSRMRVNTHILSETILEQNRSSISNWMTFFLEKGLPRQLKMIPEECFVLTHYDSR